MAAGVRDEKEGRLSGPVRTEKGARKDSFCLFSRPFFKCIALCKTSRNSPYFSNLVQICDVDKCKPANELVMSAGVILEPLFALQRGKHCVLLV